MPPGFKALLPFALFLLWIATSPRAQPPELFAATARSDLSVLFVGNSLTSTNDLPDVVRRFAAGLPSRPEIAVRAITRGSARFSDHWRKGKVSAEVKRQRPDFLILQGQSTEPLYAPQEFAHYARLLKSEADRVHAITILFSTWARPPGDSYYRDASSGGSPQEMQKRLNAAYASLSSELGAVLAPAGLAWERAQRGIPEIKLLDGSQHPSLAGTYLAAAVLCRVLLRQSSLTSSYYAGLPKPTALALQRVANETSP